MRELLIVSAWLVAPGAWVSLALPAAPRALTPLRGRERRLADRRAGRTAQIVGLRAARLERSAACVSRSHAAGAGAAAVAPFGWSAGVDVAAVGRVARRHARAVADDAEIDDAVAAAGERGAALVWALKEAAAKAAGARGIGAMPEWRIASVGAGWAELACSTLPARAAGGWLTVDDLICAWVFVPRAPVYA